jgi:hypothetical protein
LFVRLWYRYIRGVVSGMEVNSSHLFDPTLTLNAWEAP